MLFSILIPVRDDLQNLRLCLAALASLDLTDCEVRVCDDGSEAHLDLGELREILPSVLLHRCPPRGPAAARNGLARYARGRYLFFLDADVQVSPDTLRTARGIVRAHPELRAFFGSYDDSPADHGLISSFKNLLHHHTHQQAEGRISSFWCGCGVIDREVFLSCGGLAESFTEPSIEDIELGQRLVLRGIEVRCFPEFQVKHLKRWTLLKWIHTDLFRRGIPWVRMMTRSGRWESQLNFTLGQRFATLAAGALPVSLILTAWWTPFLLVSLLCAGVFLGLNTRFWRLLVHRQGFLRTCLMIPLHLLYSYVCILSLLVGFVAGRLARDANLPLRYPRASP